MTDREKAFRQVSGFRPVPTSAGISMPKNLPMRSRPAASIISSSIPAATWGWLIAIPGSASGIRACNTTCRADGRTVKRVYLAPDRRELSFKAENGYVETVVPEVDGYALVVFEE